MLPLLPLKSGGWLRTCEMDRHRVGLVIFFTTALASRHVLQAAQLTACAHQNASTRQGRSDRMLALEESAP